MQEKINVNTIDKAYERLQGIIKNTPCQKLHRLSHEYECNVYLKREDLQDIRSYKIRGAFNLMMDVNSSTQGFVCSSAGNHAQGVAYTSSYIKKKSIIFMPTTTPIQKINRVKYFGGDYVKIKLEGNNFDECNIIAKNFAKKNSLYFIPPFDNSKIISGQGTVGKEIIEKIPNIDYVICPIGGGGLISGVGSYIKEKKPSVKIIGVEPVGASSMYNSIKANKIINLDKVDTFVDGVAVSRVGKITFKITKKIVDRIELIDEGQIATVMIDIYQNEGIVSEPAGALALSALSNLKKEIRGKNVVCILSGGNNDILRYPEIMEKSLVYKGLKHYFLIEFYQKPGELKKFITKALGPNDDIIRFEYMKKSSKEQGSALVGIELEDKNDLMPLIIRMDKNNIQYIKFDINTQLYDYIVSL
jgi:threonine dehydratase